jgi:DNA-nicking Smr family endonuclease
VKRKTKGGHPRFEIRDPLLDGPADDELDLHGFTAAEAEAHLRVWLEGLARRRPGTLVHVITGKGRNSPGGAVLLPAVRRLLKGPMAARVADMALDDAGGGFRVRLR